MVQNSKWIGWKFSNESCVFENLKGSDNFGRWWKTVIKGGGHLIFVFRIVYVASCIKPLISQKKDLTKAYKIIDIWGLRYNTIHGKNSLLILVGEISGRSAGKSCNNKKIENGQNLKIGFQGYLPMDVF